MDAPPLLACVRPDCLRVVTWNLHAIPFMSPRPTARLRNVAAKIREQQPDVVLFQEVWSYAYARQLGRDLAGTYRVTTAVGCGRPFPCGGLAILVRVGSGWVASAPTFVAYEASAPWYRFREWDGIAGKGMLMVHLARGDASLGVVDTHLQTEYARYGRDYSDLRRRQLEQLDGTLRSTFGSTPVLVGGDFNTAPDEPSRLYATHLSRLGDDRTADIRTACGECGTRPSPPPTRALARLPAHAEPRRVGGARAHRQRHGRPAVLGPRRLARALRVRGDGAALTPRITVRTRPPTRHSIGRIRARGCCRQPILQGCPYAPSVWWQLTAKGEQR